jgi:CxxC-x17-CxxC domain-containing protein
MVDFADKLLTCRDCGREFTFTIGEQQFYATKGLQHEPRRCPECRNARRQGDVQARPQRTMHEVICNSCGRLTQVPFVPTGSRPVYCADCFQASRR